MPEKNICFISVPTENEQAVVPIFVVDGIPTSFTVGNGCRTEIKEIVNIDSQLGQIKKIILSGISEQLCIHPISSVDPVFIESKIRERFEQVKRMAAEQNTTISYLPLLENESLCLAYYNALGLSDGSGQQRPSPKIEPSTLKNLGFSIEPPFGDADFRKIQ